MTSDPGSGAGAPALPSADALEMDTSGRYELGATHASGGLGRVVRALDRRLHRAVAVKELLQRTPSAEARFVREALITARLEHPGIVPVYDAGRRPSGEPYYSMKLVSGRTLKELIEESADLDGRLALVPHVLAVAEAIAYAHSKEVIHRDLKPANVIVGDFGETVVIDWGLAKDLSGGVAKPAPAPVDPFSVTFDSGASGPGVTVAGNVMGTPSYMSPEQARGAEVDARADVYALGAMLYEVLVGQAPHTGGTNEEIVARAIVGEPPPLAKRQPGAPPDLAAIVTKAMAREPADRYRSAAPLAEDLRRFQTGQLVTARHYSPRALARRWIARHRGMVAMGAAAALALAVTGVFAFRRVMEQRDVAESQRAAAIAARTTAEERSHELVFRQAVAAMGRDPTATIAALKGYPQGGRRADDLAPMIDEAIAAGVARHVLWHPAWVLGVAIARDGDLVSYDSQGTVWRWESDGTSGRVIARGEDDYYKSTSLSPGGAYAAVQRVGGGLDLVSTSDGALRHLVGPPGKTSTAVFSADESRVIAIAKGAIYVWDVASGSELELGASRPGAETATLSGDGTTIALMDSTLRLSTIALATGKTRKIGRLEQPPELFALSHDGDHLIVHDRTAITRHIDTRTGAARVLSHDAMSEGYVAFSRAGDRVAVAFKNGLVVIYALATDRPVQTLRGHDDAALRLAFGPRDEFLVSSSDDATARVWDLGSGEVRVLRGHRDDVTAAGLSADGKTLATGSLDGSLRVWSLAQDGVRVQRLPRDDVDAMLFTEDGAWLLYTTVRGEVGVIEAATGEERRFVGDTAWFKDHVPALGRALVAVGQNDGGLVLLDLHTGAQRALPRVHTAPITAVALAPGDRTLLSADGEGIVRLWDLSTDRSTVFTRGLFARAAAFTRGGDDVVLAGVGWLERWTVESRSRSMAAGMEAFPHHEPRELRVSPDGSAVASVTDDGDPLVWPLDGPQVSSAGVPGLREHSTAWSRDASHLALAMEDRSVRVWDRQTGRVRTLGSHDDLVFRVAFSPDGKTIASSSNDRTVRLWSPSSGQRRVLRGHGSAVDGLHFSSDGQTLASAAVNGTLRLWSMAALPDASPQAVAARLATATSAVIDADGRATTPQGAAP